MNWDLAECRKHPEVNFFPERGEDPGPAKHICSQCPVKAECLDHALRFRERMGIWGGTSERQRKDLYGKVGRGGKPQPINHGTNGGYTAHLRKGVPVCWYCAEAHRLYVRDNVYPRGRREGCG